MAALGRVSIQTANFLLEDQSQASIADLAMWWKKLQAFMASTRRINIFSRSVKTSKMSLVLTRGKLFYIALIFLMLMSLNAYAYICESKKLNFDAFLVPLF